RTVVEGEAVGGASDRGRVAAQVFGGRGRGRAPGSVPARGLGSGRGFGECRALPRGVGRVRARSGGATGARAADGTAAALPRGGRVTPRARGRKVARRVRGGGGGVVR